MPLSLFCRRCSCQLQSDDRFCQECGLAIKNKDSDLSSLESRENGLSEYGGEWPALSEDPEAKLSAGYPLWNSIGEGKFEFANYQLELGASVPESESFLSGNDLPADKISSGGSLRSPLLSEPERNEIPGLRSNLGMSGGLAMLALDLLVPAALLCFVTVLSFWALSRFTEQNKDRAEFQRAEIRRLAALEDYETLYKNLARQEEMSPESGVGHLKRMPAQIPERNVENAENANDDKWTLEKRNFLDRASYELAKKEMARGDKTRALSYLNGVSPFFENYLEARGLVFKLSLPETRVKKPLTIAGPGITKLQAGNASNAPKLVAKPAFKLSEDAVLSFPVLKELQTEKDETQEESGTEPLREESGTETKETEPLPKFSESEISKYNRLLADYFNTQSEQKERSADHKEPPSFKEWLKEGKPTF